MEVPAGGGRDLQAPKAGMLTAQLIGQHKRPERLMAPRNDPMADSVKGCRSDNSPRSGALLDARLGSIVPLRSGRLESATQFVTPRRPQA